MLIRFATLIGALFALSPAAAADDEKLVVGTWKLTKTSQGDLPEDLKAILEVMKDGKFKLTMARGDEKDMNSGTWKLDGKKITVEFTEGSRKGMKETDTVKELTEKKMVLVDENETTEYWERVEEKKKDK